MQITKQQLENIIANSNSIPIIDEQGNIIGAVTSLEIKENKVIGKVTLK